MSQEQYDVSPKMRELFNKKQEQRAATKEFWRKQLYNPYVQSQPFDPVLFRYIGLSTYSAEYYKANYKQKFRFMLFMAPFFLTWYVVESGRNKREKLWQSGKISYEEHKRKLMY